MKQPGSLALQTPEIDEKLRRELGLRGGSLVPVLAPELVPVIIVADVSKETSGPSTEIREGYAHGLVTGVVNKVFIEFFNRTGSNVRFRCLKFWLRSTVADTFDVASEVGNFAPGGGGFAQFEDFALGGSPALEIHTGTSAAPPTATTLMAIDVPASGSVAASTVEYNLSMLLTQNTGIVISAATVGAKIIECCLRFRQEPIRR